MDGDVLDWVSGLGWLDATGVLGVTVYIGAYFALQAGLIRGSGYPYAGLNAMAGMLVLVSLIGNFNLSSVLINSCYVVISLFGMTRFYLVSRRAAFDPEETRFIREFVPGLSPVDARRVLDLGTWYSVSEDYVLTEEGRTPEYVHFILDGTAQVEVAGVGGATLGANSLIGEMSCLTGMAASATVRLAAPSRLFSISIAELNGLLGRNVDIRHEMQGRFATHVSAKLVQANAILSELDERPVH